MLVMHISNCVWIDNSNGHYSFVILVTCIHCVCTCNAHCSFGYWDMGPCGAFNHNNDQLQAVAAWQCGYISSSCYCLPWRNWRQIPFRASSRTLGKVSQHFFFLEYHIAFCWAKKLWQKNLKWRRGNLDVFIVQEVSIHSQEVKTSDPS